jgi:hypothetical protein
MDRKKYMTDPSSRMKNENDGTVEGIRHKTKPWSADQFHPEASRGGLEDAAYLFDEFISDLKSPQSPRTDGDFVHQDKSQITRNKLQGWNLLIVIWDLRFVTFLFFGICNLLFFIVVQ